MKNEIIKDGNNLPANLEDIAKFVLIGREKLVSVKAEIRAMNKLNIAKEVREQKKEEAQFLAELLIDAEVKIGELTKTMEKSKGGRHSPDENLLNETRDTGVPSKKNQLKQLGFTEKDKQRFEKLADHPEIVEKAKEEAKKKGEVVNRTQILKQIRATKWKGKAEEVKSKANMKIIPDSIKILEGDLFDQIKNIPDNFIDLLCTDPPYFVLNDPWDTFPSLELFLKFTNDWLNTVIPKVKKDTGRIYISFAPGYKYDLYNILYKKFFYNFNFGEEIIWVKKNDVKPFDRKSYRRNYEPIFYLYGKKCDILSFTDPYIQKNFNIQSNVWEIATPQSNFKEGKIHPAQKPLELYRRIILTGSNPGDNVLDCFAGSGTTGVICKETGRNCILIEKDKNYIEIMKGRINSVLD